MVVPQMAIHEAVFFIDRPSCLARATGRLSWKVSEKKKYSAKPRKSQALTWGSVGTTILPSIFSADLSTVYRKVLYLMYAISTLLLLTLGTRLAFPSTKAYVRYKSLQYTFHKSAEKIDGRIVVPGPMSTLAISSASLSIFFLKLSTTIFPWYGRSNLVDRDEENCFV